MNCRQSYLRRQTVGDFDAVAAVATAWRGGIWGEEMEVRSTDDEREMARVRVLGLIGRGEKPVEKK